MQSLAIAEIAGRDSVAAAVAAVRQRGFRTLLPTIGLVGTETGDCDAPSRAIDILAEILGGECEVLEPVVLSDPALWAAMNARFARVIGERFGSWSPCLACHLYLHLLRVPLAWERGNAPVIAGERDTHDGRLKLSQLTGGIDASIRVLEHAGVELLQPIRHASGAEVSGLVGGGWDQGGRQMGCMLSGNYVGLDGAVAYDEAAYALYVNEFLEPVGRAVIHAWRAAPTANDGPDWAAVVSSVLEGRAS